MAGFTAAQSNNGFQPGTTTVLVVFMVVAIVVPWRSSSSSGSGQLLQEGQRPQGQQYALQQQRWR